MKVVAISDQHGYLPKIPKCDLLIIAGDLCPTSDHSTFFQAYWLDNAFRMWLNEVPAEKKIFIAGNHDFVYQDRPQIVPKDLPGVYLQDSAHTYNDLKIWGTPWQPYFFGWAFNLYEKDLEEKWKLIPDDTDIIVVHGPPKGYGDTAKSVKTKELEHTGSPSLLKRIEEIKPKLVVFGHIHEGRGQWQINDTILANVTVVDSKYRHVHEPWQWEL